MGGLFDNVIYLPIVMLILLVGIYLTVHSGFVQIRLLPSALKTFTKNLICVCDQKQHRSSSYTALCTALAATVGTGNIAGVAGAIAIGGPGAIFWMWISAILGMVTKLAEVSLALHYRIKTENKEYLGGPMYTIERGLPPKYGYLSYVYCILGVIAALGVGNATQVNAVVEGVKDIASSFSYQIDKQIIYIIAIIIAVFVLYAFRKGAEGIGSFVDKLVPFAAAVYIIISVCAILIHMDRIPYIFSSILCGAFSPKAVTSGTICSVLVAVRTGVSRGVFTNESGMGTAAIAHASANVSDPMEQGLMGIVEVFLDTIVICSLTAFVILCSGIPIPFGSDPGITLTLSAFSCVFGDWIRILITALVCIFAFATILGWGLYGARCLQYIFGHKGWHAFVLAQICCIFLSVRLETSVVWSAAEVVNGLMAIPNLISLVFLMPQFIVILNEYKHKNMVYNSK